jgi:hypothetical protein
MCCPITSMQTLRLTEAGVELTCWSEDPTSPQQFPATTGQSPRTPSVVFETRELSPTSGTLRKLLGSLNTPAPFRLLSIRARTSGGATDFLPASALFDHHPTLRSTGEEDARCAEPTSATQTKTCTRTSRVPDSLRGFHRVDVPRRLRLRTTRGFEGFTTSGTASADRLVCWSRALIPRGLESSSVGVVFPRRTSDRASDTPVAIHRSAPTPRRASPALPASLSWSHVRVFTGWCESGTAITAEIIAFACS